MKAASVTQPEEGVEWCENTSSSADRLSVSVVTIKERKTPMNLIWYVSFHLEDTDASIALPLVRFFIPLWLYLAGETRRLEFCDLLWPFNNLPTALPSREVSGKNHLPSNWKVFFLCCLFCCGFWGKLFGTTTKRWILHSFTHLLEETEVWTVTLVQCKCLLVESRTF